MASVNKLLAPGVHIEEVSEVKTSDTIEGVDITTGAVIGYFKKGKIGVPLLVTKDNFESILGGPIQNAYGYYTLKGYFDNGATKAYAVRTAHYTDISKASTLTAKKSSVKVLDKSADDAKETFTVKANSEGKWGDKVSVVIYDDPLVKTKLTATAEAGATKITVASMNGVETGIMIKLGNKYYQITDFDNATKTISIDGTIGTQVETGAEVISNEFAIDVYDDTYLVENHTPLDIREDSAYYFETIVNNNSSYITVEDAFSESAYPTNCPKSSETIQYYLTGGDDGLAGVTVADLIGSESQGTGIYAMKSTREAFRPWVAESCSEEVGLALDAFCKNYMYAFSVRTIPEGYTPDEAITFRKEVGCFDSSFGSLSFGWGYVSDPIGIGKNPTKLVPLCGHVIGCWARMNSEGDISTVPAGEDAVLRGVKSLAYQLDEDEIAKLNDAGINCIIYIKGVGIVNWGARTLSKVEKWRYVNARAIFEYVEKSIQESTRWAVFQPTNSTTWNRLTLACNTFLNSVPGLSGNTAEERYSFVCNESNNTDEVRAAGKIVADVGLNIEGVGEFVIFRVGHMKTNSTVEEG